MSAKQAIKIPVFDDDVNDKKPTPPASAAIPAADTAVEPSKAARARASKTVKTEKKTETAKKPVGRPKKISATVKVKAKPVKKSVKTVKKTATADAVKPAKKSALTAGPKEADGEAADEAKKETLIEENKTEEAIAENEVRTMKKMDSSMKEEVLRKIDSANMAAPAIVPAAIPASVLASAAPIAANPAATVPAPEKPRDIETAGGVVKETVAALKKMEETKAPAAEEDDILKTVHHRHSIKIYKKIAYSFIFLTLIMLAVVAYFTFVKVTIILIPNQERLSNNLIFDIYDEDKGATAPEKAITGVVKSVEIKDAKKYPATGAETIGENATGKVTLINNYTKSQPLVATTRLLSTDGKLFRLKDTVTVPAGGSVEAEVYADQPAKDMSVPPTKFTIPGLWAGMQSQIYAESKEEIKYQQQVKKHVVQADIDGAIQAMKQDILAKAKTDINDQYKDYSQILYKIDETTITNKADAKDGDEKDEFSVTMTAGVVVVAFNEDQPAALAQQKFAESLPANKGLIEFDKSNIIYALNSFDLNQGLANVTGTFEGKISLKEGADIVDVNKIMGLNKSQLDAYLSGLPDIAGFEVKYYPSFIKRVPNLVDKIAVEVKK